MCLPLVIMVVGQKTIIIYYYYYYYFQNLQFWKISNFLILGWSQFQTLTHHITLHNVGHSFILFDRLSVTQRKSAKKKMKGVNNACNIDVSNYHCLFKWNWLLLISQITHIWLAHRCRAYRKHWQREGDSLAHYPFLHFSAGNQWCLLNYWVNLIRLTAVLTASWPIICQEVIRFPTAESLNTTAYSIAKQFNSNRNVKVKENYVSDAVLCSANHLGI